MPTTPNQPAPTALPIHLQRAIEDVTDDLEMGGTSNRVAAAQTLILAAIELLDEVARETRDRNARAYIIDHLQVIAGGRHDILSCDDNLDRWQRRLRKAEGLDPEDFPDE